MFPADESGPGAREIGVVTYVDQALAGADREHLPLYRNGLGLLDSASQTKFAVRFASATADQQDELLADLDRGAIPGWRVPEQSGFFALLRSHLQEGLFSDPGYGGNRDKLGWRFLGHPGVWLENSAEEQLSTEPVTKGGKFQSLEDLGFSLDGGPTEVEEIVGYDPKRSVEPPRVRRTWYWQAWAAWAA